MAKSTTKPPKLTREEKKQARAQKRAARRDTFRQLGQTFTITRQADSRLIPYLVLAFVLGAALTYAVFMLVTGSPWIPLFPALIFGALAAFVLFGRRAQKAMYSQASGQPGAAGWLLQNQLRGDWHTTPSVAGNAQLDAVHRLVGRPGIVLVGEGSPARVQGLIGQEKKKLARVAGDSPIYEIIVGDGAEQVSLAKLQTKLRKLPPNLNKAQVATLEKRLHAVSAVRTPLPQGPMPAGAKIRNLQRTARRRSGG